MEQKTENDEKKENEGTRTANSRDKAGESAHSHGLCDEVFDYIIGKHRIMDIWTLILGVVLLLALCTPAL